MNDPRIGVLDETDSSETVPASSKELPCVQHGREEVWKGSPAGGGYASPWRTLWIAEANH
jgi:hypothetical protein